MTLLEVMASLAILSIAILGLTAGMAVASSSNALAARRTQMSVFAQSRLERLVTATRTKFCSAGYTAPNGISCATMGAAGTFTPASTPNQGGWMLDVIDGPAGAGDDVMNGPVLVMGDNSSIDVAKTLALRTAILTEWASDQTKGCSSTLITGNPASLCREIHVEPFTAGTAPGVPMLDIWVRVVKGGTAPLATSLVYEEVISQ